MNHYRAYGATLASAFPLSVPAAHSPDRPAIAIDVLGRPAPLPAHWVHAWRHGRRTAVGFARVASGYLLRFEGLGEFLVAADGSLIRCIGRPPEDGPLFEHLLLDQVVPLALARQGLFLLHASAVHLPGFGAVAIAGRTGRGKSTLASVLAARGTVIADDGLRIDQGGAAFEAVPSYPGLRLVPGAFAVAAPGGEHTGAKRRSISPGTYRHGRSRLRMILVLSARAPRGPAAQLLDVPPAARVPLLARHQFQIDPADRAALQRSFGVMAGLAATVPILRLRVRDSRDALADAAAVIVSSAVPPCAPSLAS